VQVTLLGFVTLTGALLGIGNGMLLLSLYVDYRPNGTFYFPPLNIVGNAWILLGVTGVLLGGLLIVAGIIDMARNAVAWVVGIGVYATLLILSVAQIKNYFTNAAYSGEDAYGVVSAIVSVLLIVYLIIPRSRVFFRLRTAASKPRVATLDQSTSPAS
jgi:hypothetical protein